MLFGVCVAELKGFDVWFGQFGFFLKLFLDGLGENRKIQIDEKGQGTNVNDIFQQLS